MRFTRWNSVIIWHIHIPIFTFFHGHASCLHNLQQSINLLLMHTKIRLSFILFFLMFFFHFVLHSQSITLLWINFRIVFCSENLFDCFFLHPIWVAVDFSFFFLSLLGVFFPQRFHSNFNTKRALNSIFKTSNIFTYAHTHTLARTPTHTNMHIDPQYPSMCKK